jgi:hypothetical protein
MVFGLVGRNAFSQAGLTMKVFDLQCAQQHCFEGWFASEDDYGYQQAHGLVACPICGDATVRKMLSAPRLNLKSTRASGPPEVVPKGMVDPAAQGDGPSSADVRTNARMTSELSARLLHVVREVMAKTEDVGERFADQARAMHYGDIQQRSIRGQATPDEAMALVDEGIEVMPLPWLPAAKETLQ